MNLAECRMLIFCRQRYAKWFRRNLSQPNSKDVISPTTSWITKETKRQTGWIAFGPANMRAATRDSVNSAASKITSDSTKMRLRSHALTAGEAGLKLAIVTGTKRMHLAWEVRKERFLWRNLASPKRFWTRTTDQWHTRRDIRNKKYETRNTTYDSNTISKQF